MKALLIIPPCPARWLALEKLLDHERAARRADLELRFTKAVESANDAFAIIPDGGQILANACIAKRGDAGVLRYVFTHPDHRRRGFARSVIETLTSWFNMVGGKWLYASATADVAQPFAARFGFRRLHGVSGDPHDTLALLRRSNTEAGDPFGGPAGDVTIRDVTRADDPLMVSLMQHRAGSDPRVPLAESACAAQAAVLDLIHQQEQGTCKLLGAFRGTRIVAIASVATDPLGERTYAMRIPHDEDLPKLREAVLAFADGKGYKQVDFPLETLAETTAAPGVRPDSGSSSLPAPHD